MKIKKPRDYYQYCPSCRAELVDKLVGGEKRKSCPKCEFIFWDNPKPVVSALIIEDEKVLMVQRAEEPLKNYWCLPGGFMESEETAEAAIKREVEEEVGVRIKIEKLLGVYRIDNDPRGIHIDLIFVALGRGEVKLGKGLKMGKFFEMRKLPNKIAYKHREAIGDYFTELADND